MYLLRERSGARAALPAGIPGLAAIAASVLVSCQADPGYAVEDDRGRTKDAQSERWPDRLTGEEQESVRDAMRLFAEGQSPSQTPRPADHGMRFSDVESAAFYAAVNSEMALLDVIDEADGARLRFQLVTIEEWPAELIVERIDGPEVYRARASVGRFPQMDERQERAEELLNAFDRQMRSFGRKPRFPETDADD